MYNPRRMRQSKLLCLHCRRCRTDTQTRSYSPTRICLPNARANRMPEFMSRALIEARTSPIQTEIVEVNISSGQPRDRGDCVESPEFLICVRIVVEHAG